MTVIIKHLDTGNEYILLSTGLGTSKSSLPSRVFNDLFPSDHPEKEMMVAACDVQGRIVWLKSNDIIVTEIEGKKPSEILPEIILTPALPLFDRPEIEEDDDNFEEDIDEDIEDDLTEDRDQDFDDDDEEWV